jgi:hypothetical protein
LFAPTPEGEARLLLLISEFSSGTREGVAGRTKLAKLDFLLRYPAYFERALAVRVPDVRAPDSGDESNNIETPMVRFRYGPWDPAYFALLGALIGRRLIVVVPGARGLAYRATDQGKILAEQLAQNDAWSQTAERVVLLRRHFDLAGTTLKNFIYREFPEVVGAQWGEWL